MNLINGIEFQNYLQALSTTRFENWWGCFIYTDAAEQVPSKPVSSESYFEFDLMVELLQPPPKDPQQQPRKTEIHPVLDGIRKYALNHVLLIGRPGSGKTTALQRLLIEEAKNTLTSPPTPLLQGEGSNTYTPPLLRGAGGDAPPLSRRAGGDIPKIPVLIELRFFQKEDQVIDRLGASLRKYDPHLKADAPTLKTLLQQGKFLLLFDGLNELSSEEARQTVRKFREDNPHIPMIFTTRDIELGGNLGIENTLQMQPLTEKQMQEYIQQKLPETGEELWRQLQNRLREFGQTPLLLWMLCELFKQTGQIPTHLGLVFRQFTQGYERFKEVETRARDDERHWWQKLLQYLAFRMIEGDGGTEVRVAIPRGEAERVLIKFLEGKVAHTDAFVLGCLDNLLKHHLINLEGDNITFLHQLIQEYYGAEYLCQILDDISDEFLKHYYLNYLKWTEPLALMMGLLQEEKQAVRVVQLALLVDVKLGARLAGEVIPKLQQQTVSLVKGLQVPQLYKIWLLGETKSELVIDELINAIKTVDVTLLYLVAESLKKIGNETAITPLINEINDSRSSMIRLSEEMIESLKKYEKKKDDVTAITEAIDDLIENLKDSKINVRLSAVKKLEKINNEAAIPPLIDALKDKINSVRSAAAEALGNIGNETAIEPLINVLKQKNCTDIAVSAAAQALKKLGNQTAIPHLINILNNETLAMINYQYKQIFNLALGTLTTLQETLKYYNPEIAQAPPPKNPHQQPTTPITYDFRGANIGNVAHNVQGNQQTLKKDNP